LQEETRRVLRLASVIGRVFLYRVLAEIAREERELDTRLLILQREQLIRERARVPEIEYIFKHELTREAAYNGLLLRERRAYHRQVAQALERLFPERVDELLGTLAHHWERAGDVEQGLSYLRRAGEQAAGQYANAEAVAYFSRALDLLPEERREERFALLLAREEIHHLQGSREAQEQDLRALQRLGERLGSERDRVIVALRRARCASQTGEVALARSILEGMLPLIEQVPDVRDRAESYLIWARHFGPGQFHGLHVSRRPQLEKAVDLARAAALKDLEAQSLRELGLAFWQEENAEQALLHLEDALRLSREIGDRKVEGMTCNAIGWILSETGHDVEAQPYLRLGIPLCRETGNRYDEGWGTHHLALSHYCQGDLGAALGGFQCVVDLARVIQVPMLVDLALWGVGLVYGDLGQYAEAAAYCERVLSGAREAGDPLVAENALWYLGRQMHCLGDDEGARASGEELLDVAQAQGDMTAEYGAWVLLGHARIGLGDLDGADDAYQRALEASSSLVESLRLPPRVGLVRVALLKGGVEDLQEALPHVEGMLRHWEAHPDLQRGVPFEAFEMCWTCYRLLEAIGDPRAPDVLTKAYNLVQTRAAQLKDPAHRRAFLEDVRVHREIVAEYERRSAQPG
jgi:tetratricopeptide (TPR) repeat protein